MRMNSRFKIRNTVTRFAREEHGTVTLEFVLVFPVFFGFFLATYESGMISARHVMLERGVDMAVRDVRLGALWFADPNQFRVALRERICDVAMIIPDCENQVELEMLRRDPSAWVAVPSKVSCIDRSVQNQPVVEFTNGGNNELVILRACARIDPVLPTTGLGKTIVEASDGNDAAGGSYALVSMAAFVVEPFQAVE